MITGPDELVQAAVFYAQILGIADFDLEIRVKKYKHRIGSCMRVGPKQFLIKINTEKQLRKKGSVDNQFDILAHEMVHVKQYHTGELIDIKIGDVYHVIWKGELFVHPEISTAAYYDAPWEIEAFGRQVGLAARWFDRPRETLH